MKILCLPDWPKRPLRGDNVWWVYFAKVSEWVRIPPQQRGPKLEQVATKVQHEEGFEYEWKMYTSKGEYFAIRTRNRRLDPLERLANVT